MYHDLSLPNLSLMVSPNISKSLTLSSVGEGCWNHDIEVTGVLKISQTTYSLTLDRSVGSLA